MICNSCGEHFQSSKLIKTDTLYLCSICFDEIQKRLRKKKFMQVIAFTLLATIGGLSLLSRF